GDRRRHVCRAVGAREAAGAIAAAGAGDVVAVTRRHAGRSPARHGERRGSRDAPTVSSSPSTITEG
ncbi:MAG TPA: hypothetical protein VHE35_05510, partial [Kofleriaceae bacterium]|nr:hypothetical protein [Kofleriaceae bacterium]